MKVWKRNAVVAAIVLFVCVAVYLNWSYQKEGGDAAETGKTLGEAALVSGQTADPLLGGTQTAQPGASRESFSHRGGAGQRQRLFCLRPAQPAAGPGQCSGHPSGCSGQ